MIENFSLYETFLMVEPEVLGEFTTMGFAIGIGGAAVGKVSMALGRKIEDFSQQGCTGLTRCIIGVVADIFKVLGSQLLQVSRMLTLIMAGTYVGMLLGDISGLWLGVPGYLLCTGIGATTGLVNAILNQNKTPLAQPRYL